MVQRNNITMVGFNFEKALPYFLGGAFLYFLYKKVFFRDVEKIKDNAIIAKVKYSTMTDFEKKRYAKIQADLILDLLRTRFFSSWRNNDDVVAVVKSNSFCIDRIGEAFDDHWFFAPLSRYLVHSLPSSEIVMISEELEVLREKGF